MDLFKKLKTKVSNSADFMQKKLGQYLTYLANKTYENAVIFW